MVSGICYRDVQGQGAHSPGTVGAGYPSGFRQFEFGRPVFQVYFICGIFLPYSNVPGGNYTDPAFHLLAKEVVCIYCAGYGVIHQEPVPGCGNIDLELGEYIFLDPQVKLGLGLAHFGFDLPCTEVHFAGQGHIKGCYTVFVGVQGLLEDLDAFGIGYFNCALA